MEKIMKSLFKKSVVSTLIAGSLVLTSASVTAVEKGDWLVRFGAVNVSPNDSSSGLSLVGPTATVGVDGNTQVFANLSYMIKENVALELLAATPFSHDIVGTGALSALGKVGETKQLPPTFSIQYHFKPKASVRPYVGAGINYTIFFSEKATNTITSLKLDDSLGLAVQAGVDVDITKDWFFNADIRYINIETTATTDLGTAEVKIDPTVISIGVGTRF
jgi:outer membrane protein